jgi:ribosomal protein L31E
MVQKVLEQFLFGIQYRNNTVLSSEQRAVSYSRSLDSVVSEICKKKIKNNGEIKDNVNSSIILRSQDKVSNLVRIK